MAATGTTIINNVAVEVGLDAVTNPFSSTDQNFIILRTLLNTAGNELLREFDWSQFTREASITGDGTNTQFAVPADFDRYLYGSGWNRTNDTPFSEPLNPQEWQLLKTQTTTGLIVCYWRFWNGQIEFLDAPASGDAIKYEYISTYWVGTSNGVSYGTKASATLTTDYCLLNERALTRLLKLKWLQAKSLDTKAAEGEYATALRQAISSEPAKTLYLVASGFIEDE